MSIVDGRNLGVQTGEVGLGRRAQYVQGAMARARQEARAPQPLTVRCGKCGYALVGPSKPTIVWMRRHREDDCASLGDADGMRRVRDGVRPVPRR